MTLTNNPFYKVKKLPLAAVIIFIMSVSVLNFELVRQTAALMPHTPAISVCGARQNSDIQQYTGPALPYTNLNGYRLATTHVMPARGESLRYWPGVGGNNPRWYTMSRSNHPVTNGANYYANFTVYDAVTKAALFNFTITPSATTTQNNMTLPTFDVDPLTGDVYAGAYSDNGPGSVSRWKTDGTLVWKKPVNTVLAGGVYGYRDAAGTFRVAASIGELSNPHQPTKSVTFDQNGNELGYNAVAGKAISVSREHNNDIVAIDDSGYVRIYNSDGQTIRQSIGAKSRKPGPWSFYVLSDAVVLNDGTVVVYDGGRGMEMFTQDGVYKGKLTSDIANPDNHAGGAESMMGQRGLIVVDGKIYYITNDNSGALTSIAISTLRDYIAYPQGAPFHLGIGAGPFTTAKNGHFPPGVAPEVKLSFSDTWRSHAGVLTGSYTIRSIEQIKNGEAGTEIPYTIPADAAQYIDGYANIPVTIPSTAPGLYEMNVVLRQGTQTVGADCLRYSVGAPGTLLDFNQANMSAGGDVAEVEFARQTGQKLYRSDFTIRDCYPGVTTATADTPINCPASMVDDITRAANLANSYGMKYEIMISDGATPMFSAGSTVYKTLLEKMVRALPAVTNWECWNEPDTNTFSSGADYVARGLIPCYEGVKNVSPNATVIGGTFVDSGMTSWWQQFIANGLSYVDVIGVHPYTGHNRSFEEQGHVIPELYASPGGRTGTLQTLLAAFRNAGFTGEVWDTEQGFWDTGPYNSYTQGERFIRKQILEASLGITRSANFKNNVGYKVNGLDFTLVHNDALTTGGLAGTVYGQQLGNRQFREWLPTSMPRVYAASYGAAPDDSGTVVAVWSDDATLSIIPTTSGGGTMTTVDQYGQTASAVSGSPFSINGAVTYVHIPAGQTVTFAPVKLFNINYASKRHGASATASSARACNASMNSSADRAIDGIIDTENLGGICDSNGKSVWTSAAGDNNPSLTIQLAGPTAIDRVIVYGQSIGSVETGLRGYDLSFDTGDGTFGNTIHVDQQYLTRSKLTNLPSPLIVSRMRLSNITINYSGYGNGLPPTFWDDGFPHEASVFEVEAYGPGTQAPSIPTGLRATAPAPRRVKLTWNRNTGTIAVTGYNIYRNGTRVGTVRTSLNAPYFNDMTVRGNTTYTYTVAAFDAVGNISGQSSPVSIKTPQATGTITGTIKRPSGAGIAGATATLTVNGERKVYTAGTNGVYTIPSLPPNTYKITYKAAGFNAKIIPITVTAGTTTTSNVFLSPV